MYEYKCIVKRVVDGDTVDVNIDLGFNIWMFDQRIRLNGVDTPEVRTRDDVEKKFGILSMEYVMRHLPVGSKQVLVTDRYDADKGKYGRILGTFKVYDHVELRENSLVDMLIRDHMGVAYHGQNRETIQEEHLKNREVLYGTMPELRN